MIIIMSQTITIPKEEYIKLKKIEQTDRELVTQLVSSLKDIKEGKIKRVA